jgi:DNA repair protein RecN (Recombination protein N)
MLATLESADRIGEALTALRNTLDDEELGALTTLTRSQREFEAIGDRYSEGITIAERLRGVLAELKDISNTAADQSERLDADPERLQKLSDRLHTIYSLDLKHRAESYDDLLHKAAEFEARLATIDNSDTELRELQGRITEAEKECREVAIELRNTRQSVCKQFEERIVTMLRQLGMDDAQFIVEITPLDTFTPSGCDSVAYLFTANRTTRPAAIERVASGGELSRVMLALKSMLVEKIKLPTVVFDEIDTGVSGSVADKMGSMICDMGAYMQVFAITHLPQVAAKGTAHYMVSKEIDPKSSKAISTIARISDRERVLEIARMLSGSVLTDAAIANAESLLCIPCRK